MTERGILDGLAVVRAALQSATSLAAMLMTIDAIILRD
jgi:chaperonin GroEL (HSP60 family)